MTSNVPPGLAKGFLESIKGTGGVDFDGVIHQYSKGWHDGSIYDPPVEGTLEALAALMKHWAIFVHTSRPVEPVAVWLREQGLRAQPDPLGLFGFWNVEGTILVTRRKVAAAWYLDDRGIRFVTWEQALAFINGLER